MLLKFQPVGAEGIGFDNISSGLYVGSMDLFDQFWAGKVQLVVAGIDKNPSVVELCTHGAIKQDEVFLQKFDKWNSHELIFLAGCLLIVQIRIQPFFDLLSTFNFAFGIIEHLIASYFTNIKIL